MHGRCRTQSDEREHNVMHKPHQGIDRRTFLVAGGMNWLGLAMAQGRPVASTPPRRPAKSTILIWLSGGASHIDTWDMKPDAPVEVRGPFKPIATSASGIRLCEHLPLVSRQAHHLAIVRSVGGGVATNDHHAGYYYQLTGHVPEAAFSNSRQPLSDDWPFFGSVVAAKRPAHPSLPSLIWLPAESGEPGSRRPGAFAARLGVQHDPFYVYGSHTKPTEFLSPSIALSGDVSKERLSDRRQLLQSIDASFRGIEGTRAGAAHEALNDQAFSLLGSSGTRSAFDVSAEPGRVRERYGNTVNAMSMLMARRLAEAGVPFITVYWYHDYEEDKRRGCLGGAWDTHWKNASCLRDYLLPAFDRPFSALLDDLHQRGLLDSTLVIVSSEMGRTPRLGDPRSGGKGAAEPGRDHWTHCMSVLLAGGGIRGGQVYGASDRIGAYPADQRVGPEHIARTVYHAMGISDLQAVDRDGRPFHLLEDGRALTELF